MLTVLVSILVVFLALVVVLWTATIWAQSYFYDSATNGLSWRAPAAAGAVSAFFLLWLVIEYRRPKATDTLFNFTTERSADFNRMLSVRRAEDGVEQEIPYERHPAGAGRFDFRDEKGTVWARSSSGMMVAIILEEPPADGGEVVRRRFNAEMENGKFAPKASRGKQSLRYLEDGGNRFIVADEMGKVFWYNRGTLVYNFLLNGLHFVLWFAVLWLLLRFQWAHALGFAAVCWLIVTLVLLPYLLGRARDAAERRGRATTTAALIRPARWA